MVADLVVMSRHCLDSFPLKRQARRAEHLKHCSYFWLLKLEVLTVKCSSRWHLVTLEAGFAGDV